MSTERPPHHRRNALLALGVVAAGILALTSFPTRDTGLDECLGQLICGERGVADVLTNIILFLPLGWALRRWSDSSRNVLVIPPVFSTVIELVQIGIPGRHPNPGDVLFNSIGGWLGAFVAIPMAGALLARRGSDRAALGWATCMVLILGATGGLLQTKFPRDSIYFGQWTPTLGGMAPYRGTVLSATLDTAAMPSFALSNTRAIHAGLERGDPVTVRFVVGPEPDALAPIFAIADRDQVGVLLFGVVPGRLIVSVRTYAEAARLDVPNHEIPIPPAMAAAVGDTVTVTFRWPRPAGRVTFSVNGVAAGASAWTLARGWALLYHRLSWPPFLKRGLDAVWMAMLFMPLGLFSRASIRYSVALAGVTAAVIGIAAAAGLAGLAIEGWGGALAGIAVGYFVRRIPIRVSPP